MRSFANAVDKPVFVFTGMGPQWWAMGHELLEHEPVFRRTAEQCDAIFQRLAGWSILAEMTADEYQSQITAAHLAPPANFVLQAALAALWRAWGIEPSAIVGHSLGEVAAAHAAGVLDLNDAVRVSYHIGRLLKQRADKGGMLAIRLNRAQAQSVVARAHDRVCIAAVNSPSAVTLAGEVTALEEIASRMEAERIQSRFLHVPVAYHSHQMELLKAGLRGSLEDLRIRAPRIPLYSTVTGRLAGTGLFNANYWCNNLREPVLFESAMASLIDAGHRVFLEVGPHPVLSKSIEECLRMHGANGAVLASLRRGESERKTLRAAREALKVQPKNNRVHAARMGESWRFPA